MKEAGWMLQLLLLCAAFCAVIADCPQLEGAPFLHERVQWSYNENTNSCVGRKAGSLEFGTFRKGEMKSMPGLGNDCLQFRCDVTQSGDIELYLHEGHSYCLYRDSCGYQQIQSNATCSLRYYCQVGFYDVSKSVDEGANMITGQFTVFTRYKCTPLLGSGPCPLDQCYDFQAPRNTSDVCLPVGTIIQAKHPATGQLLHAQCQEHRPCNDETTYVDWSVDNISTPAPPTTTSVPPSPETTTAPEIEPPVITVPTTEAPEIEPPVITVPTTEAPEIEPPVITVPTTEAPEIEPPVITVPTTEAPEIEPPVITVPTTEAPEIEPPVITPPTNPEIPTVIFATLDTTKCRPSKRTCKYSDNTMGCKYRRQCYPVNTQISWDDCTQFECHGDADRSQGSAFPRPTWLPRYIGCYGPSGCLTFGQKVRDVETDTVYNCTYTMGDLGFPVPEFRIVTEEDDQETEV